MSIEILQSIDMNNIPSIAPIELFYRDKPLNKYDSIYGVFLKRIISFNTFWGAFPLKQWLENTNIKNLQLNIRGQGKFILKIKTWDGYKEEILYKKMFDIKYVKDLTVDINLENIISPNSILYPEFEIVEDNNTPDFILHSIAYSTSTKPVREPKLALIVPTYKREKYILKLIDSLLPLLKNQDLPLNLLIIDNGRTLNIKVSCKKIKIIPNLNYGGSGGFSRGILESLKENYTHLILADDDIVINPDVVKRVYQFFKFAKTNDIVLGGGMLKLYSPHILNEKGALIDHLKLYLINSNLDLTKPKNLIDYIKSTNLDYFAWWFFAGSLKIFETYGLPMPFFIRWDDQEFCLRIKNKVKFLPLFGLAVWHEDFDKKDNPVTDYYITRNGLITSALYEKNKFKLLSNLLKYFGAALLTYRYERAKFILKGIEDFLKGPEFLEKIQPDIYHKRLNEIAEVKPENKAHLFIPDKFNVPIKPSILRKFFIFLTLNGHLLPSLFMKRAEKLTDEGFIIEPLHSKRLQAIFRKTKVLYYEPANEIGLLYTYSKKKFWKYLIKGILKIGILYFKYSSLQKEYKKYHKKLTSIKFWKKYLKLEDSK